MLLFISEVKHELSFSFIIYFVTCYPLPPFWSWLLFLTYQNVFHILPATPFHVTGSVLFPHPLIFHWVFCFTSYSSGLHIGLQIMFGDLMSLKAVHPVLFNKGVDLVQKCMFPESLLPGKFLFFNFYHHLTIIINNQNVGWT